MFRYYGEDVKLPRGVLSEPDGFFSFGGILEYINSKLPKRHKVCVWDLVQVCRYSDKSRFQVAYRSNLKDPRDRGYDPKRGEERDLYDPWHPFLIRAVQGYIIPPAYRYLLDPRLVWVTL